MRIILLSLMMLISCATTTTPPNYTTAYICIDNNPYKDGACSVRAMFVSPIDCLQFLSITSNNGATYTMCSINEREFK